MDLTAIGGQTRRARLARGLTQAQLAAAAHLTRTTVNQFENGLLKDLGIRKVQALLGQLGLVLEVLEASVQPTPTDFLHLASRLASVSFREALTEKELLRTLLTGKVPSARRAHVRQLLEEAPEALREGLIRQVAAWSRAGKVAKNLNRIAVELGI